jgi:hypothetical protein
MQRIYQLLIIIIGYKLWCKTYGRLNVKLSKNKYIKDKFLKPKKEIAYYEDDEFIRIHKRDIAVDTIKGRKGGMQCYFGYPSFFSIVMMKISLVYILIYLHDHHHTSIEAFIIGIIMYNLFIVYEIESFYKTHSFKLGVDLFGVGLFFSFIIYIMNILDSYF